MSTDLLRSTGLASFLERAGPAVFDVGARGGLDEDFAASAWATTIVGFEPEPAEAERLAKSPDPRWRKALVAPIALGPRSGVAQLHLPASPAGASLLPHNPAMIEQFGHPDLHRTARTLEVETKTLDDAVESLALPQPDFIKLDIEGAELGVLQEGRRALSRCVALKVECAFVEQRVNQPLAHEVIAFLREQGFDLVEIRDMHAWRRRPIQPHPLRIRHAAPYSRGLLAQADLIFLRAPAHLSEDGLALRAALVATILGFVDHAVDLSRHHPSFSGNSGERATLEKAILSASAAMGARAAWVGLKERSRALIQSLRSALNLTRSDGSSLPW